MRKKIINFKMIVSMLLILVMAISFMPAVDTTVYAESDPVITTDKTEYQLGEEILVTTQLNGASGGWVALYSANSKYEMSIYWYYPHLFPETRPLITNGAIDTGKENWGTGNPTEGLPAGEYKLVYAYGPDGVYPYSIMGEPTYFTILEGAPAENSMRVKKTTCNFSDPINVTANCESEGCWVGLYGSEETPGSDLEPIYRYNVVDTETFDLKSGTGGRELGLGDYKVILFGDSGYSNILQTVPITIVEDPLPQDELTLSYIEPDKTTYKLGEPVYIRATGTAAGAWVGLYHADDKTDPNSGGSKSLRWYYVSFHNGEKVDITDVAFDDNGLGGLPEGDYRIILFGDSGYNDERVVLNLTLQGMIDIDTDSFSLETNKTDFNSGEDIKVTASGTGIADGAWVGLYPAGSTSFGKFYLYKYKVKGKDGQEVVLQQQEKGSGSGTVPDGFYTVVLFADSGYSLPVLKKDISVTKPASVVKRLKEPGCRTLGLEYIKYEDGTETYREIPTLGGHIWGEPKHIEGTEKHVYTCERDSSHQKTEACRYTEGKVIRDAAVGREGLIEYTCDKCGSVRQEIVNSIKAPALTASEFVYTGENIRPALPPIVDEKGKAVPADQYTVTYPAVSSDVGTYCINIEFKGNYSGVKNLYYTINPAPTILGKLKAGKKSLKARWMATAGQVTGYQVAYSRKKNFSTYKVKNVENPGKTSLTVKKLKKKKRYYVQVRTYKVVNGTYYYSEWSNIRSVKTKKK